MYTDETPKTPRINYVEIKYMYSKKHGQKGKVLAKDNEVNHITFEFNPDEIDFETNSFIGLTKGEVLCLARAKLRDYVHNECHINKDNIKALIDQAYALGVNHASPYEPLDLKKYCPPVPNPDQLTMPGPTDI